MKRRIEAAAVNAFGGKDAAIMDLREFSFGRAFPPDNILASSPWGA